MFPLGQHKRLLSNSEFDNKRLLLVTVTVWFNRLVSNGVIDSNGILNLVVRELYRGDVQG